MTLLWWGTAADAQDRVRDGDTVAIVGDSITQARKYSALMEAYLLVCRPARDTNAFLSGWSGQTAADFDQRVTNDVIRFGPTVVTASFGMNDGRYAAFNDANATLFRNATRSYVQQLKRGGARFIVLGSPGCVDTFGFRRTSPDVYNDTLKRLGDVAHEISLEEGVMFVDVHTPMLEAMRQAKSRFGAEYMFVGKDGFHPDWSGHHIMAYAYLRALIGRHEIGTIRMDLAAGAATASEGHAVLEVNANGFELESSIYPYCYFGDESDPAGTRSAAEWSAFNGELNRLMMIVTGAPPRARVTWGAHSKEFTREELAEGINLAGEFLDDNPFETDFVRVLEAVQTKQTFEIHMVKSFVNHLPVLEKILPDEQETLTRLSDAMTARRGELLAEVRQAFVPVRHRIRIEPVADANEQPR